MKMYKSERHKLTYDFMCLDDMILYIEIVKDCSRKLKELESEF